MKHKNKVTEPEIQLEIQPEVEPTVEPTIEPEVESTIEPEVEPTVEPEVESTIEPEVEPTVEPEVKSVSTEKTIIDNVALIGCKKLNVRKEPSKTAEVVCVLDEDSEFTICLEESTNEFFKVYTVSNDVLCEGYCLKEYIHIK